MNPPAQVGKFIFKQQTRKFTPVLDGRLVPYTNPADTIRVWRPTSHNSQVRLFSSSQARFASQASQRLYQIMSSDDAYSSFLDQANQDTGASKSSASAKTATTKAVDTEVPAGLLSVEQYYTSEADEPFEPVSLQWDGQNMPSENEFAKLIGHGAEVTTMTTKEFDPREQYKEVLQAVGNAGEGKSSIFRVGHGKTRVEYYVVGLDRGKGRVVGMKAKAVES
ncbi:MAG: hypothetical protein Q9180_002597 [Flavoplaca navasiana]